MRRVTRFLCSCGLIPSGVGILSKWDEYWDSPDYDPDDYDSDRSYGIETFYEYALELLPGGSEKTDVEMAISLMRSAAHNGNRQAKDWLSKNEKRYCDDRGQVRSKWKQKKPTSDRNPPKDKPKPRPSGSGTSQYQWKTERKTVEIHEPAYYEDLYCGVIERKATSFSTLLALGNCGDQMACYYLGIFLEKVATTDIGLLYAMKWFHRGSGMGNRECAAKYAELDERLDNRINRCPCCGSKMRTIPSRNGGYFKGCSRYPECKYTCDPGFTEYYELNGVIRPKMSVGNALGRGFITERDLFDDYARFGLKK